MSILSNIVNAARTVTGRGPSQPAAPSTTRQGPATVSVVSPAQSPFRRDDARPSQADLDCLRGYSRSVHDAQYRVNPIPKWENDAFNAEFMPWLPPQPAGKAPWFYQGIWNGPMKEFSKAFLENLQKEAQTDGKGPLITSEFQEQCRADASLWKLASDAALANRMQTAYHRAVASREAIADELRRGTTPDASQPLPGTDAWGAHSKQYMDAAKIIFGEVSQRYASLVFPICERLRNAAQRLARRQAKIEQDFAEQYGSDFNASGLLLSYITFGMTTKIGQAGWQQPFYNIRELGCSLPPSDAPWCKDYKLFKLPDAVATANHRAMMVAKSSLTRTSANKAKFFSTLYDQPNDNASLPRDAKIHE